MSAGGRPATLPDVLRRSATRHPERTALVADGLRLSYAELAGCVDALAGRLLAAGLRPGDRAGLCVRRGPLALVASAALLRLGCAYVPLDVRHPQERLQHVARDAGLAVAAADEAGCTVAAGLGLATVALAGDDLVPVPVRPLPAEIQASAEAAAYVMYTSGSTGVPKGVTVTHANVVALLTGALPLFGLLGAEAWPLQHAHSFDVSVWEMWAGIAVAATLTAVDEATAADPERLAELLLRSRPTRLHVVPSVFGHLADVVEEEVLRVPLPAVVFCGERVDYLAMRRWERSQAGSAHPPPRWLNVYGITETTVYNTLHELTAADLDRADPATPIGLGYPTSPALVVGDGDRPLPPGRVGEIVLGGPQVSPGYHGRPELTAARFGPLPDRPGRWYRTGDLGRVDPDGALRYVGRRDDQVKLRGFRVELGEIDHALQLLPWLRQGAVAVQESARGEPMLTAFVVPGTGEPAPDPRRLLARIREALARRLPEHMLPARVVCLDRLPLNANGKTDRRALTAAPAGPAEPARAGAGAEA